MDKRTFDDMEEERDFNARYPREKKICNWCLKEAPCVPICENCLNKAMLRRREK